jgi:hypothetical protein
MITHLTINPSVSCLNRADRTGSSVEGPPQQRTVNTIIITLRSIQKQLSSNYSVEKCLRASLPRVYMKQRLLDTEICSIP